MRYENGVEHGNWRTWFEDGNPLVACVNVVPGIQSIYRWEGSVQEDAEVMLLMKTPAARVAALTARVEALHPYDVSEVLAVPVAAGSARYLDWVRAETAAESVARATHRDGLLVRAAGRGATGTAPAAPAVTPLKERPRVPGTHLHHRRNRVHRLRHRSSTGRRGARGAPRQ